MFWSALLFIVRHAAAITVLAITGGLAWRLRGLGFASPRMWATLLVCSACVLGVLAWRKRSTATVEGGALVCLWFLVAGTAGNYGQSFDSLAVGLGIWLGVAAGVGAILLLVALERTDWNRPTAIGAVGSVLGAVAVGWVGVALVGWVLDAGATADLPDPGAIAQRRDERAVRMSAWGDRGRIAVTLSGGGYRAAVVHAGLLSALEEARVPIHYLSTVSGGSIIGGAYALGWTGQEFAERLRSREFHIVDDLMSPLVFMGFFAQIIGTGDVYVRHLERIYFSDHRVADTRPVTLLVNTTSYLDGARKIFWNDPTASGQGWPLARVVGASGAFPTVFTPVVIDGFAYMDGGVRENFGLEGLEQYLETTTPPPQVPRVLLVSDMSAPHDRDFDRTPTVFGSTSRAFNVLYEARSRAILDRYIQPRALTGASTSFGDGLDFITTRNGVPANQLWRRTETEPVLVKHLSPPWIYLSDNEEAAFSEVRDLGTLTELSACQVDLGFWVGRRLAEIALPDVCRVLDVSCPLVSAGAPPHGGTCMK